MNKNPVRYCHVNTPLGALLIAADSGAILEVHLPPKGKRRRRISPDWTEDMNPLLLKAKQQFKEYFAGKRKVFDLPLSLRGSSGSVAVWGGLASIPYGETLSYGELAQRIGRPRASRAVGSACGRNPLPILLPCHRVIGSSGSLTGFGGGIQAKQHLLKLEESRK